MLAAAPVPVIAQTTPTQQTAQASMTPDKVRADMRAMKDMSYSELSDAVWKLQQTVTENETLTRAVIEGLPQFLLETKDSWKWNHAHLLLQAFMQSNPGGYDADIDRALTKFLTDYARDTIGVKDPDLESRLYNIAILSKTPALQDMQVDSLAAILPQGDFMTWVHVLRTYGTINENRPGRHESTINALLEPSLKSFEKHLTLDKNRYGASYLIAAMGNLTPALATPAIEALLPYIRDPNPSVQKNVTQAMTNIGYRHAATTQTAFDALAKLAPDIDKPDMGPDAQYYTVFGLYYLAKDAPQRGERALALLQQIALKLPGSNAIRHIADLGGDLPALRAEAVNTLRDCMTYDINASDAANGLIDIAKKDSQYAPVTVESMNAYLIGHPGALDMVLSLAYLAKESGNVAPSVLKIFQTLADQESPAFDDPLVRGTIMHIGAEHGDTLPAITSIFEKVAVSLIKRKDWETLEGAASDLDRLQIMTEEYNHSIQRNRAIPAPGP